MASFWDRVKNYFKSNAANSSPARRPSANYGPTTRRERQSPAQKKKSTTRKQSSYSGGNFTNFPRSLMTDKAKREAGQHARGADYSARAKAAGVKPGPKNWPGYKPKAGIGGAGGIGGGGGDYGTDPFQEILESMGGSGTYTPPEYKVDQIDVEKTLANIFGPQFKAIGKAEGTAKSNHKASDKAIQAAYAALSNEIRNKGGADIDKTYADANKTNQDAANQSTKNLANTASQQFKEEAELMAALGVGSAIDSDSGGRGELNKGIADINKSSKDSAERLNELKVIDKQLNRSSADVSGIQGENRRADLRTQLNQIVADLGQRRLDTESQKGNKRADLEAQNQAAVNQANAMGSADYQAFQKGQSDIMEQALKMSVDRAKMQQDAEFFNAENATKRYGYDASVNRAQISAAGRAGGSKDGGLDTSNMSAMQKLISRKPGGLGVDSLTGIVDNLTDLNRNGNWDDALAQYNKKYKKSNRSKQAAAEYVRIMKRG